MDETEKNLKAQLENAQNTEVTCESGISNELMEDTMTALGTRKDEEASISALKEKLDNKKKELVFASFLLFIHLISLDLFIEPQIFSYSLLQKLFDCLRVLWKNQFRIWRRFGQKSKIRH